MEQFLLQPKGVSEQWQATLEIVLDKQGKVQNVKIVHSSGSALHDRTAVNTVYKAQPLPLPTNQRIKKQFMHFRLNVSPRLFGYYRRLEEKNCLRVDWPCSASTPPVHVKWWLCSLWLSQYRFCDRTPTRKSGAAKTIRSIRACISA